MFHRLWDELRLKQGCLCVFASRAQGCSLDSGPHHPRLGSHCCGVAGHPQSDGAHPSDPAAEVLPASLPTGRADHRPAWLHGHNGQRKQRCFIFLL